MAGSKIDYRIKLLSGNNVILVEAAGYESEIFIPSIDCNGRIAFINVMPNRRCCGKTQNAEITKQAAVKREVCTPLTSSNLRESSNKENVRLHPMRPPLANSTPAAPPIMGKSSTIIRRIKSEHGTSGSMTSSNLNTFGSSSESTLPTPEPFRRAVPATRRQLVDNTQFNLPKGIKVMRLYHNSRDGTPSKVGRLVNTGNSSNMNSVTREDLHNMSNMSCSFRIPATPTKNTTKGMVSSTPLNKQKQTTLQTIAVEGSNSKWRKCITPVRTYSKRGAAVKRNPTLSSQKKALNPVHFRPTYLVNPTQGCKPAYKVELRRRRLVVDGKVRISSRAFKRQQQQQQELDINTKPHQKSILGPSVSFTSLHKMNKEGISAFDLLTNSNRSRCLSAKLKEQFRKGCVNKASSTYNKYKVLCSIPPLQKDEQVLELTQSLMHSPNLATSAEQMKFSADKIEGANSKLQEVMVSTLIKPAPKPAAVTTVSMLNTKPNQRIYNINRVTTKTTGKTAHNVIK